MKQALAGLSVLNTRPAAQGELLAARIRAAGGESLNCPTLSIEPCTNAWWKALETMHSIDKAIFISANAVAFCFQQLDHAKIKWPVCKQLIAVGEATAKALSQYLKAPIETPPLATSESLIKLPCLENINQETILLIKGRGGRRLIAQTLRKRGANLIPLAVYKRGFPSMDPVFLNSLWHEKQVDIILITSEQSMYHLFRMVGEKKQYWLCTIPWLVISQRLATLASNLGVRSVHITEPDAIFEALCHLNQGIKYGKTK